MATVDALALSERRDVGALTDILERLVLLQHLLNTGCGVVVVLTDNTRVQHTRLGVQRVDSWVDTQLRDTTGKHSGGVQMGKGSGRSGISQIVSGDVDSLDGSDGSLLRGGDTLLHQTHVHGQSGLVSDRRWNTTEQSRDFRSGLSEAENIVDEEKHILAFLIAKVFCEC